ncbi:MAG: hypothetical protein KAQ92_00130 [Candidatus Aenigmarchaeota archaeon]|nr:hypothetical protein [Candidatus Aenigmarchaeota archaeon]
MNKIIFLMTILLLAGFATADAGNAFLQEEAGISAYVNIGESIDLNDATQAYNQMLNISQTHSLGIIRIANEGGISDDIHVYVDTAGWIVAYLQKEEETAKMIQWSGINTSNPVFERTTLSDALSKICDAIDVNYSQIKDNISYYDFKYPDADKMKIFTNTRTSAGYEYVNLFIPDSYELYEASYSLTGYYYDKYNPRYSSLYLNEKYIASARNRYDARSRICESYGDLLTPGDAHTIKMYGYVGCYAPWAGVANILIYS